ncbi:NAD(P)-dependent alcohol dehydrogenase [Marinilabilia rubra]|uniref:NAD(P)-dependent alcohol dehydrogenase n=1 Tax=Marinilabilia rubra TaxID=2162893 RepID=A0A2U2B9K7_9BACT|nr:NAD(P)-dependent alcohol dehydrogenase [Marinilabilia rubra]PWD99761.1 NAD(P)-dependent alcohol dehydrogenase [Marinilabilia rubra]
MKAATRTRYGSPEVLSIRETERPNPAPDEILVRVKATTVNRTDCGILWGKPFIIRLFTGLMKPASPIPGTDFAGETEAVGSEVSKFKTGDRVLGFSDNGLASQAEYMTIKETQPVIHMPESLSFEEAAACSEGAHYAVNFINKVPLTEGCKVLVNGATGAIGSAAVQFLNYRGAIVTATCRTNDVKLVESLGAGRVIDYTANDFTNDHEKYDFIFDSVGKSTFGACKKILKSDGIYISSELGPGAQNPLLAVITSFRKGQKVKFPLPSNIPASLDFIVDLVQKGQFRPLIDRTFSLEQIREAYEYVAGGQKKGNVIIKPG